MAASIPSSWVLVAAALLIACTTDLFGDGERHINIPAAASAQELQDSMPLGSSWPARELSYLVSPANAFCFGWLQFPSASHSFYVAVWYASLDSAIVWVANRDAPASADDTLQLTPNGNLFISNATTFLVPIWQTNTQQVSSLEILDSGNVVLRLENSSIAWQSFSSPTDTLLPSQLFLATHSLISRPPSYSSSLASGNFRFYVLPDGLSIDHFHASTGESINMVWQAEQPLVISNVPSSSAGIAGQFLQSGIFFMYNHSGAPYSQFVPSNYRMTFINPIYRRLTLDPDGNLRMYGWDYVLKKWVVLSKAISDLCTTMPFKQAPLCGSLGVCVAVPEPACACPPGFHPMDLGDVSRGCSPDNNLPLPSCQSSTQSSVNITYLVLHNADFLFNDILLKSGISLADCQSLCTDSCSCMGAVFDDSGPAHCWLKRTLINGYSPQAQYSGSRDVWIKVWNSTISAGIMNPPYQINPTLAWINTSAFWSQTSGNFNLTTSCPTSPPPEQPPTSSYGHRRTFILTVSAISAGELLVFFLLTLFLLKRTQAYYNGREAVSSMQQEGCRAFSYAELVEATNDFQHLLGSGAFGAVTKGVLKDGREIAVKRLQTSVLHLADTQFRAEIVTLGRIHHMNLLRLYGYCAEGPDQRLLVYEFIEKGSLNRFLFESGAETRAGGHAAGVDDHAAGKQYTSSALISRSPACRGLDWSTRYNICLGTARGLAYLHEECLDCIVHCDIKPENILLDAKFCPKLADFGLAYLYGRNETLEVSNVRGTRGYLAPEWLSYLPITAKADVFSYGMVLIEIVSGRRNYRFTLSAGRWEFPSLAFEHVQNGRVEEVVDPKIRAKVVENDTSIGEVEKVLRVAFLCLHQEPTARPSMRSIVQMLEGSLPIPVLPPSFRDRVETGQIVDAVQLSHIDQLSHYTATSFPSGR